MLIIILLPGRHSNQGNHRDGGAQILQVNQLQHQYNMFTASSLLPQNQPPGTGERDFAQKPFLTTNSGKR